MESQTLFELEELFSSLVDLPTPTDIYSVASHANGLACSSCGKTFKTIQGLTSHRIHVHGESAKRRAKRFIQPSSAPFSFHESSTRENEPRISDSAPVIDMPMLLCPTFAIERRGEASEQRPYVLLQLPVANAEELWVEFGSQRRSTVKATHYGDCTYAIEIPRAIDAGCSFENQTRLGKINTFRTKVKINYRGMPVFQTTFTYVLVDAHHELSSLLPSAAPLLPSTEPRPPPPPYKPSRIVECQPTLPQVVLPPVQTTSFSINSKKVLCGEEPAYYNSTSKEVYCLACQRHVPPQGWVAHSVSTSHAQAKACWPLAHAWVGSQPDSSYCYTTTSASGSPQTYCLACADVGEHPNGQPIESSRSHESGEEHKRRAQSWRTVDKVSKWSDVLEPEPLGSITAPPQVPYSIPDPFRLKCYPALPVKGSHQWVSFVYRDPSLRWEDCQLEVVQGNIPRAVLPVDIPNSRSNMGKDGFLRHHLCFTFQENYGKEVVLLRLLHKCEVFPLGKAVICSHSSQREAELTRLFHDSEQTELGRIMLLRFKALAMDSKRKKRKRAKGERIITL